MTKLTGLYKATSKDGTVYLSDKTQEDVKCLVLRNNKQKRSYFDNNLFLECGIEKQTNVKANQNNYHYISKVVAYNEIPFLKGY